MPPSPRHPHRRCAIGKHRRAVRLTTVPARPAADRGYGILPTGSFLGEAARKGAPDVASCRPLGGRMVPAMAAERDTDSHRVMDEEVRSGRYRHPVTALDEALDRLPKVELHCHIEGTMRPATLVELAASSGHALPTTDSDELYRTASSAQKQPAVKPAPRRAPTLRRRPLSFAWISCRSLLNESQLGFTASPLCGRVNHKPDRGVIRIRASAPAGR